jgi:hypothetical protein
MIVVKLSNSFLEQSVEDWLFGFCLCVGLWGGAKPNVPMRGAKVTRLFNLFFSGARESIRLFE